MPTFIIKLPYGGKEHYMFWSTVVDAPTSYGMNLEELKSEFLFRVSDSIDSFERAMERVNEKGTSSYDDASVQETIDWNRAGDKETCLTVDEIIQKYIVENPNNSHT